MNDFMRCRCWKGINLNLRYFALHCIKMFFRCSELFRRFNNFITIMGVNQAFSMIRGKVGAFGGIWTRDHYLTKVTPHRARLRRQILSLVPKQIRLIIKRLRSGGVISTKKHGDSTLNPAVLWANKY